MKCNRVNSTLTFSAALAGLALIVFTPSAHGHGNNPKNDLSDTDPNTGTTPPPGPKTSNPPIGFSSSGGAGSGAWLDSILDPGIVIGIDLTIENSFDVTSKVISAQVPVDLGVIPLIDLAPQIAADGFDASGTGSISAPSSSVIPAPGTLALLGLAAAAAGRRRRRR